MFCCVQYREAEGGGGGGEEGNAALQHVHRSLMVWGELPLHGIVCGVVETVTDNCYSNMQKEEEGEQEWVKNEGGRREMC